MADTIEHTGLAGCECGACGVTVVTVDANVDGTGGIIGGKTVFTLDQVVANMNRSSYGPTSGIPGPQWNYGENFMGQNKSGDASVIYFGFYQTKSQLFSLPYVYPNATNTGLLGRAEYAGFAPFSLAQQDAARKAVQLWDDIIAVKFVEQSDARNADITFGNLTNTTSQAYAYLPYNYGGNSAGLQGDIWVNVNAASNLQLGNGFYGLATLVHEFGHAIGLQHPGAYNAAPGLSITYPVNAEYYQDTRMYSQMSYFQAENSGGGHIDWNRVNWVYGQTPLLHDIATSQAMYGADLTTRTGDTVYGFNSNAGRDVYDFSVNSMPVISIYDAGGIDTLDLSGFSGGNTINLNAGAFSSAGGSGVVPLDVLKAKGLLPASYTEAQYLALRTRYHQVDGMLKNNISIAYGTIVENAIGGAGNDSITGNAVANVLSGLAGNDVIFGGGGDDTLNGGLGGDAMSGNAGNDLYFVDDSGDLVAEVLGEGTDTVSSTISYTLVDNVENLLLTGAAASGTGNGLDNVLTGNALANLLSGGAGNDTLIGGEGDDTLDGGTGDDAMSGGLGNDLYYVDAAGDTVIELGGEGIDTVSTGLSAYTLGANVENLILTGGAASGTGNGLDNVLTGNALSNRLDGGAGADRLIGGDGVDFLTGGAGADVFVGEINAAKTSSKMGDVSLDVVLDFVSGTDKIDLSGIDANTGVAGDQAFTLVKSANPSNASEISIRHFGNINAAEAALGFDIDGVDGPSAFAGPVKVVLGNVDGGAIDFAMVFVGTPDILATDFLL